MRLIWAALAFAFLSFGSAAPTLAQQQTRQEVDARAEVAMALYASSATQAAAERASDARLRTAQAEIARLAARGASARAELIAAQDRYVADLATRDRAYAQEIAVFRNAVQDIASTPDGTAALARFNRGDEVGALAVLDQLRAARDAARQVRAGIESAGEARRIAALAVEARDKGKLLIPEVVARFEEIVRLDPGVQSDWLSLSRLYHLTGHNDLARNAAERALALAATDDERSLGLDAVGRIQVVQGDLAGARTTHLAALEIDIRHHDDSSAAVALSQLGDIAWNQSDFESALQYFRQCQDITTRISAEDPESEGKRTNLSFCVEGVGGALLGLGDYQSAIDAFTTSLAIRQANFSSHSDSRTAAVLLWTTRLHLGDACLGAGELPRARAEYLRALEIAEHLADSDTESAEAQRNLATTYQRLGDVEKASGNSPAALSYFQQSLLVSGRLAALDPSSWVYQRDLMVDHTRVGDEMRRSGRLSEAAGEFAAALEIIQRLHQEAPESMLYSRELGLMWSRIAQIEQAQGRVDDAIGHLNAALEVRRELATTSAASVDVRRDLAVNYSLLASANQQKGNLATARGFAEQSLHIFRQLADERPESSSLRRDVAIALVDIASLLVRSNDAEHARPFFLEALGIERELARERPDSAQAQRDLLIGLQHLAIVGGTEIHAEDVLAQMQQMRSRQMLTPDDERAIDYFQQRANSERRE